MGMPKIRAITEALHGEVIPPRTNRDPVNGKTFRVFSFRRWSSRMQNDGDSDRRQLQAALDYCDRKGWTLDQELVAPAQSGYHQKNGGPLASFFKMVETGTVKPGDVLLFEGFDRFSRQPPDLALPRFLALIHAGIEIHTILDGQIFTLKTVRGNQGQLYGTISAMWGAYLESHNKGGRIRESWKRRRNTASLVCPGWLRPKPDKSGYNVIPRCAAAIARIYEMAIAGHGYEAIARKLNQEGEPPFQQGFLPDTVPVRKRSKGWHYSYVKSLLTDRRVIGEVEFFERHTDDNGKVTKIPTGERRKIYPEAISEAVWQRCQETRRRPNQGKNSVSMSNLFGARLANCVCGASMVQLVKGAKGDYKYLQCLDARRGQDCQHRKLHRYEPIEAFVLAFFGTLAYGEIQPDETTSVLMAEKGKAQREADDIEASYNRLAAAIEGGTGALAAKRLAALESQHVEALARLAAIEKELNGLSTRPMGEQLIQIQELISGMDKLDDAERVAVRSRINRGLASFIDRLVFNDPNPPENAIRPAETVHATEWYVRFKPTVPARLAQSWQAKLVIMLAGWQTGRLKPVVKDGMLSFEGKVKVG
jgi:DNA invertase Pin-like site-specific DNA recombinase